ncbi:hypothetical protein C5167_036463 [Papaver somniferum]|uniref:Uncharacterized protein n=1 Tax=Papaver somniferum TaxID=3469 RepID=A0A4Y7I623_PAPSO|nr:hypothetical protein C5167_036463 [Papaver somniferum]
MGVGCASGQDITIHPTIQMESVLQMKRNFELWKSIRRLTNQALIFELHHPIFDAVEMDSIPKYPDCSVEMDSIPKYVCFLWHYRSVLDDLSDEEVESMIEIGENSSANSTYGAFIPDVTAKPGADSSHGLSSKFIR